jgi:hypothetical protein
MPTPDQGTASAALYGVSASGNQVWAVGETIDPVLGGHPLIETFAGGRWQNVTVGAVVSPWSTLWGVSATSNSLWAVGNTYSSAKGAFDALVMRGGAVGFQPVAAPNPSSNDNDILQGVGPAGDKLVSVGLFAVNSSKPLVEVHPLPTTP